MKRIIIYILLIVIFTFLGIVGYKNKPVSLPDKEILNKEFYNFNKYDGTYDTIIIKEGKISYTGTQLDLKECTNYTYTIDTSTLSLSCGKDIRIVALIDDTLALMIDGSLNYFNLSKTKTFEKEFKDYYNTSYNDYIIEVTNKTLNKQITNSDLNNLTDAYVLIKPTNSDYRTYIALNMLSDLNNSYFINENDLIDTSYKSESGIVILSIKDKQITENIIKYKGIIKEKYIEGVNSNEENN